VVTLETPHPTWLTTLLRPGGELDPRSAERLVAALATAARSSDVVVVDVQAVGALPPSVCSALVEAHRALTARDGALVVIDPEGRHGLTREHGDVVQTSTATAY
jgi:anti-anti-sigma regulatory factor